MAMINCPECRREISDQAKSCPNCGAPIKKKQRSFHSARVIVIILVCIAIPAAVIGYSRWYDAKIEERYKEEFWNSDEGQKVASALEDIKISREKIRKIHDDLISSSEEYQAEKNKWDNIDALVDEIFDLAELDNPTAEQIATIKEDIEIINSLGIEGLKLEYDDESGEVLNVK